MTQDNVYKLSSIEFFCIFLCWILALFNPFVNIVPCFQFNLLKPTGYVMHQQFNIQQLYALPTLYLSENKQRLVPLTA